MTLTSQAALNINRMVSGHLKKFIMGQTRHNFDFFGLSIAPKEVSNNAFFVNFHFKEFLPPPYLKSAKINIFLSDKRQKLSS